MPNSGVLDRAKEGLGSLNDKMYCIAVSKKAVKYRRKTTRTYQFQGYLVGRVKYRRQPSLHRYSMEIIENTLAVGTETFRSNFIQLENAVVAFLFEERMRLGTVAIAMPGLREVAAGRSSILVGAKYLMVTRALAEKLAAKSGRIAIVSLFTELDEAEALRIYMKLLEKIQVIHPPTNDARGFTSSIRQHV